MPVQRLGSIPLLCVLLISAGAMPGRESADGPTVYIAYRKVFEPAICEDGDGVRAYLLRNGKVRLNNMVVDQIEFGKRLDKPLELGQSGRSFSEPTPKFHFGHLKRRSPTH
jgi:hypothetical protein